MEKKSQSTRIAKTILKRISVDLHYSISRLSYANQDSKQLAKGESADE